MDQNYKSARLISRLIDSLKLSSFKSRPSSRRVIWKTGFEIGMRPSVESAIASLDGTVRCGGGGCGAMPQSTTSAHIILYLSSFQSFSIFASRRAIRSSSLLVGLLVDSMVSMAKIGQKWTNTNERTNGRFVGKLVSGSCCVIILVIGK